MSGYYDFASAFIVRQYGPCPNPVEDPDGEERWHARLGLVAHALGEFSQPPRYTLDEIKALAMKLMDETHVNSMGKITVRDGRLLGAFIAYLQQREKEGEG